MSEDNQQQNNQEKKPRETLEQFANRVGLKYVRGRGGIQFAAYPSGNLLHKRPKQEKKPRESTGDFYEYRVE